MKIKRVSDKRKVQELEYKTLKNKKKVHMIEKRYYKCFFCNTNLNTEDDSGIGWHHLNGKDGDLISVWGNIEPAHNLCHSNFHHYSVKGLLDTKWYAAFIERLKTREGRYPAIAYNKELRRLEKADVIDNEQFLLKYRKEEE